MRKYRSESVIESLNFITLSPSYYLCLKIWWTGYIYLTFCLPNNSKVQKYILKWRFFCGYVLVFGWSYMSIKFNLIGTSFCNTHPKIRKLIQKMLDENVEMLCATQISTFFHIKKNMFMSGYIKVIYMVFNS